MSAAVPRIVLASLLAAAACSLGTGESLDPPGELAVGAWGGNNSGAIVSETELHVHFGCTLGDFMRPAALDSSGSFSVSGSYVLRAFPIQLGPSLPARVSGVVRGRVMTLSVAVDDTVQKKLVLLGPTTLVLGRDASMGPCPICDARMVASRLRR